MKKKIISLCLVLALAATAIVGASLAYFTDTDTETNTFTTGNVKIDLVENFPETKLLPGEKNALTKEVTVKNVGTEDAYLWIELWIPTALDAGQTDAANNSLHFNPFDTYKKPDGTLVAMRGSEAKALGYTLVAETVEVYLGTKIIDGVSYTGYREYIKNDTAKKNGESTYNLLSRVFMDQRVAQCTEHNNCLILANGTTHYTGSWEIIVNAFGIQAEGFANIEEAIAAYNAG